MERLITEPDTRHEGRFKRIMKIGSNLGTFLRSVGVFESKDQIRQGGSDINDGVASANNLHQEVYEGDQ